MFDSGIMIDSAEGKRDNADLAGGRNYLQNVKQELENARKIIAADWKGEAAAQCDQRLAGFIEQIDGLIGRTNKANRIINDIIETYSEADRALSGHM